MRRKALANATSAGNADLGNTQTVGNSLGNYAVGAGNAQAAADSTGAQAGNIINGVAGAYANRLAKPLGMYGPSTVTPSTLLQQCYGPLNMIGFCRWPRSTPSTQILMNANPNEQTNNLLDTIGKAQAVKQQAIGIDNAKFELAMKNIGAVNSTISSLLGDPDVGKTDISKKIIDATTRLVKDNVYSAQHVTEALKSMPTDPAGRRTGSGISIRKRRAPSSGRSRSLVAPRVFRIRPVRGSRKPLVTPAFRFATVATFRTNSRRTRRRWPLPIRTTQITVPRATSGPLVLPASAADSSGARAPEGRVLSHCCGRQGSRGAWPLREACARHLGRSPGTARAMEGAAESYNSASEAAGKYAQRVNPLRSAIPILEKMNETDIGPTSERWNDIKSTAITLGAGKIIGGIDPEKIKNYNELKKYLSQYSAQAAATMGPKTNDGLATAVTSNPNTHMDKLSALELTKVALGVERMQQAGVREFNCAGRSGQGRPVRLQQVHGEVGV
jgi:hypothetical protein